MQIFLRSEELHAVEVAESDTVAVLKAYVEQHEGVLAALQTLTTQAGRPLSDEECCGSVLTDGARVEVSVGLAGGKVHGSLARAGKVKGQTPKVEKGEKKKRRTGRSKRRMQYNRRFVNVVATFGRRRGPNANPAA